MKKRILLKKNRWGCSRGPETSSSSRRSGTHTPSRAGSALRRGTPHRCQCVRPAGRVAGTTWLPPPWWCQQPAGRPSSQWTMGQGRCPPKHDVPVPGLKWHVQVVLGRVEPQDVLGLWVHLKGLQPISHWYLLAYSHDQVCHYNAGERQLQGLLAGALWHDTLQGQLPSLNVVNCKELMSVKTTNYKRFSYKPSNVASGYEIPTNKTIIRYC